MGDPILTLTTFFEFMNTYTHIESTQTFSTSINFLNSSTIIILAFMRTIPIVAHVKIHP